MTQPNAQTAKSVLLIKTMTSVSKNTSNISNINSTYIIKPVYFLYQSTGSAIPFSSYFLQHVDRDFLRMLITYQDLDNDTCEAIMKVVLGVVSIEKKTPGNLHRITEDDVQTWMSLFVAHATMHELVHLNYLVRTDSSSIIESPGPKYYRSPKPLPDREHIIEPWAADLIVPNPNEEQESK